MFSSKQKLRQIIYKFKHDLMTPRNVLVALAGILALSWVISAILAMQQNYHLQKQVDKRKQQLAVLELETATLDIEKEYYKSSEYQELMARQSLGLANQGEKVLILPPYSNWVKQKQREQQAREVIKSTTISNFNQWINFLFGSNRQK